MVSTRIFTIAYDAKSVTVFLVWHAAIIEPACLQLSETCHDRRVLSNRGESLLCVRALKPSTHRCDPPRLLQTLQDSIVVESSLENRTPSWPTTISSAPVRLPCDDLPWTFLAHDNPRQHPVRLPCHDLLCTFLAYNDLRPHQSDYPVMTCRVPSWPTTISVRTSQIILWWLVVHLPGLRRSPSAPVRLSCNDLSCTFLAYDDLHPHQSDYPVMTCRTPSWSTTIPIRTSQIIL